MTKFDLTKTQELVELIRQKRETRDDAWIQKFLTALPTASLRADQPQVVLGPDNQAYFVLRTPENNSNYSQFSVVHVLDTCLQNGFGIAINPNFPQDAECLLRYGLLWHFKESGDFEDISPLKHGQDDGERLAGQTVMISSPSDLVFPPFARRVIYKVLKVALKIETPAMLQMLDPDIGQQRLIFNLFPEDCASEEEYYQKCDFLSWYLPASRCFTVISKNDLLAKKFQPLVPPSDG